MFAATPAVTSEFPAYGRSEDGFGPMGPMRTVAVATVAGVNKDQSHDSRNHQQGSEKNEPFANGAPS